MEALFRASNGYNDPRTTGGRRSNLKDDLCKEKNLYLFFYEP